MAYNSVPPIDLIVEANDQVETSEAILFYAEKAGTTTKTNSTYGIGWEFMGLIFNNPPDTITVGNEYGYINDNGDLQRYVFFIYNTIALTASISVTTRERSTSETTSPFTTAAQYVPSCRYSATVISG